MTPIQRTDRRPTRRATLLAWSGAMTLLAAGRHAAANAASDLFPEGATMLVAGPQSGRLEQWAGLLAPALARNLQPGLSVRRQTVGGADGVTGANQFEARVAPDGQTVLLLPGEAALAWLVGDPRARFDAAHWVPVLSGVTPAIVVGRVPLVALPAGAKLRIAAGDLVGPDLAALLALELLGITPVPVCNLHDEAAARAAFEARAVDAVFLRGEHAGRAAAALAGSGGAPIFTIGLPDDAGGFQRDAIFSDTPMVADLMRARAMPPPPVLYAAWRVSAAAAQTDFTVVLPQLAPAAIVSLWRRAAAQALSAPELQAAGDDGVRMVAAPAQSLPTLVADADSLVELRRWLATRFNWKPA